MEKENNELKDEVLEAQMKIKQLEQKKAQECLAEINTILNKYGYTFEVQHTINIKPKQ